MNEETEELLIKAEGKNKEKALDAMIMLSKVYTYGLYGEKKDLEKAEFWSKKANNLKQTLPKKDSVPDDIFKRAREFKRNLLRRQNLEANKTFATRFNNIGQNIKFVNPNNKQLSNKHIKYDMVFSYRFDNIQNNLRIVNAKNTTYPKQNIKKFTDRFDNIQKNLKFVIKDTFADKKCQNK